MDKQQTHCRVRHSHDERRDEILRAVVAVCAEQGLSRLSVSGVTARVGCTRSLFYHYFPSKEAAFDAALELTIDAFIERLRIWDGERVHGDIEGALDGISHLLKTLVVETPDLSRSIAADGDAILYTAFVDQVAERCARFLCETTVVDFSRYHDVLIDHVYETFYILISGLILFIRSHPDADEAVIKDIIANTLHIESYTEKYAGRRAER